MRSHLWFLSLILTAPVAAQTTAPTSATSPAAVATAAAAAPRPLSASDADFLNQEKALNREVRLLELKAKAADLRRKVDGADATQTIGGMPPLPAGAPVAVAPVEAPQPSFRLMSVYGTPGNYTAEINAGRGRVEVRVGSALPGAWIVSSIRPTEMVVSKGKRSQTLSIGE